MRVNRIQTNQYKGIFFLLLFIALTLQSLVGSAQMFNPDKNDGVYVGISSSFGGRSFSIASNIPELNNLHVVQEGGQLGITMGTNIVRASVGLAGFFYSSSKVPHTVDLYQGDVMINLYPLSALSKKKMRVEPYLTGGIVYSKMKFYGYYLEQDVKRNYSTSVENLIGYIHKTQTSIGTGIEFRLIENFDFVHIFSQVRYGFNLTEKTKTEALKNTSLGNQLLFSVGVRFGRIVR